MNSRAFRKLLCLYVLLFAASAGAQAVYKSTMPDGKVTYGPEPAAGAKKVEKIKPNTQDSGVRVSTPDQKRNLDQRESQRQEEVSRRTGALDQLKLALKQAEEAREAGRDPRDGDTTGNARGGTRLNEDYWERQKALEAGVQEARKRLEEAQQAR
jgi:hypothetical protein